MGRDGEKGEMDMQSDRKSLKNFACECERVSHTRGRETEFSQEREVTKKGTTLPRRGIFRELPF